jgi:hypothetical protein
MTLDRQEWLDIDKVSELDEMADREQDENEWIQI